MSIADSASANGLLSTPLVFPAPLAGALAALILVMVVMLMRRSDSAIVPRLLVLVSVIAVCILVTTAILDRLEMSERTAEQRALLQRDVQLSVSAITSGSLACLDVSPVSRSRTPVSKRCLLTPRVRRKLSPT